MNSHIKTRFLIISDTHGDDLDLQPLNQVDVAIHCGDMTEESKFDEFKAAVRLLKKINAPLKLVIAENHDFTMDFPMFKKKLADIKPSLDRDPLYPSQRPYTPSLNDWGLQYHPKQGHDWCIDSGVDVAITHGPPKGLLDCTDSRERAGSASLFGAIARARPRMHCFGHIHEAWGAKKVTWRSIPSETPSHFTDIDNDRSMMIENLSGIRAGKFDTPATIDKKMKKLMKYNEKGFCTANQPMEQGAETLFVNAAVQGTEETPLQLPWMVDIELSRVKTQYTVS